MSYSKVRSRWIPVRKNENLDYYLRAVLSGVGKSGETVYLYKEDEDFIYVPRHVDVSLCSVDKTHFEPSPPEIFPNVGWECVAVSRSKREERAYEAFSESSFGVLNLACGLGKTVQAIRKIAKEGKKAAIVVHTKDILEQWIDELCMWLKIDGRDLCKDDIGIISGTKSLLDKNIWEKPIVLCMIQTLCQLSDDQLDVTDSFGVAIYDEAHHLAGKEWLKAASVFRGMRFGLTATPFLPCGTHTHYMNHIGEVFYADMEQERSPECYFLEHNTGIDMKDPALRDVTGEFSMSKAYGVLGKLSDRNALIHKNIRQALDKERIVLVLSFSKEHCSLLAEPFEEAHLCTGDVDLEDRREGVKKGQLIVGTMPLGKEALNRKDLDTVIIASPFKDENTLRQVVGRVLRPYGKSPLVIVIEDIDFPPSKALCLRMRRILRSWNYNIHTKKVKP